MTPLWGLVQLLATALASNVEVYKMKVSTGTVDFMTALDCARCNNDHEKCQQFQLEKVKDDFTQIPNMEMRVVRVDSKEVTWFEAKRKCSAIGAELLTLDTPEKRRLFVTFDPDMDLFKHWTSLSNTMGDGVFRWNTGQIESLSNLNITTTTTSPPNTCVYIHLRSFGILPCSHSKGFACQKNNRVKRSECEVSSV